MTAVKNCFSHKKKFKKMQVRIFKILWRQKKRNLNKKSTDNITKFYKTKKIVKNKNFKAPT
jgi:hypothetical protein